MATECAGCGCLLLEASVVFCDDCRAPHEVCPTCAEEWAAAAEGDDLVA